MNIPKWLGNSVRKCARHNEIAGREETRIRKWLEEHGLDGGDGETGLIDSLIDAVVQTNKPDIFITHVREELEEAQDGTE